MISGKKARFATCFALFAIYSRHIWMLLLRVAPPITITPNRDDHRFFTLSPLFLNVGLANTGTQSIHQALCELGIPSVHFNRICFKPAVSKNNCRNATLNTLNPDVQYGIAAHRRVMMKWKRLNQCIQHGRSVGVTCNRTLALIESMRDNVVDVLMSGVQAIHSVPYTFFLPFILETVRDEDRRTILLLTERRASDWNLNQVESLDMIPQVACHDPNSAFDVDYCLLSSNTSIHDLLPSYSDANTTEEKHEFMWLYIESMDHYQLYVKRHLKPDYVVNLFDNKWSKKKLDMRSLKKSIWKKAWRKLSRGEYYQKRCKLKRQLVGGGIGKRNNATLISHNSTMS